jgi:hypothetical protein
MDKRKLSHLTALLIIAIGWAGPLARTTLASSSPALSLPRSHALLTPLADDPSPPAEPVKLIFIHHSTGGNWLADPNSDQPYGGLGRALMENNYFVSATNYGWGPEGIGDRTDVPNWPEWFTGPNRDMFLAALYDENGQNVGDFGAWPRLPADPGGENTIVMFKSCFPNSDLYGEPGDPPHAEPSDWEEYSVGNAKAIYNDLLTYFETRQDKLFIVVTAPPLMSSETAPERAVNARAFNNWLVNDWLTNYPYPNVAVFDYYNVLTAEDNHHRWTGSEIEHVQAGDNNFAAYPSGDSHPSTAGHQKATAEFVPLLNVYYNRWQAGAAAPPPPPVEQPTAEPTSPPPVEEATEPPPSPPPVEEATEPPPPVAPPPAPGVIDDFESAADQWMVDIGGEGSNAECGPDGAAAHGGANALRLSYDVAPQEWVGCGRYFESPQDWSSGGGISFWLRSDDAGQWITLALFSGAPDSPTPFEVHFEIPQDWTQLTFAWGDLERAEWADEGGLSELDPARITGLGFSLGADEERDEGAFWLDDLSLASDEIQSPPQPPTVTEPPAPDAPEPTHVEPAEAPAPAATVPPAPDTKEESGGGGPCPGAVLPLGVVALVLARKRWKTDR